MFFFRIFVGISFFIASSVEARPLIKIFNNVNVLNSLRTRWFAVEHNAAIGNDLTVVGDLTVLGKINSGSGGSGGGVSGPSSSTINAVPRFANGSGNVLENSSVLIDDAGNITINGITKNGNTLSWPSTVGAANTVLTSDGAGNLLFTTPAGGGNVSTVSNFTTNNSIITVDLPSGTHNIKQSGITMPSTVPTAHQMLIADATTPTNLDWATIGANVVPAVSRTIYVATYGNDITGDGSQSFPYATVAKGINEANSISSLTTPVSILISPGIYIENNSTGPLTVTAAGVSIDGGSSTATIIEPNTLSNDLLMTTADTQFGNLTLKSAGVSTAAGLSITAGAVLRSVLVTGFNTGISTSGSGRTILRTCFLISNTTCLDINNVICLANDCSIAGINGTGLSSTGSGALVLFSGGLYSGCSLGVSVSNNSMATINGTTFRENTIGLNITNSGQLILQAGSFELNSSVGTVTNIQASGAGTSVEASDCIFNSPTVPANNLTAIQITGGATCIISSGQISMYRNGLIVGNNTDTSSTQVGSSGLSIMGCTNDIIQQGSSTLNFNMGVASTPRISINNSANVKLAYFDPSDNDALQIGSFADQDTELVETVIGLTDNPVIEYKSSLYNTQAIGYENEAANPATLFSLSPNNTDVTAITTDRTKIAGVRLVSDTATPVGGTTALRGWDINKNASTAELSFSYQNSDTVGQGAISEYTVMQLDGVNNQLQLPNTATQIVFANDTNLYRGAADTLKTDDNLIIGGLTANRAVATDVNKQLVSNITTDTELGYVSGVTSPIQTQLNSKISTGGATLTGALQLPAGTTAAPSLNFTGSPTTGLSASSNSLSISTNGNLAIGVSSAGVVSIPELTPAGVVHNDVSGNLTTSLIVNADVAAGAAIADTKLGTIATVGKVLNSATTATNTNTPSAIVARDASGNFSAGTITATLTGAASLDVLKAGDTMTGSLQLPAGIPAAPSLQFTGSTSTGLSAPTANTLSFDTNGTEQMNIDGSGNVTITGLNSAGVVHTNGSGTLSTSSVVNNDIADATISNAKLATISSADTSGNIVVRDGSGNFATNMITIDGTTTNPTDVATKSYVDSVVSLGLDVKAPALVASTTNVTITGLQTIDGVTLAANDRVLLVGQTNAVQNGLWLAQSGAWTRPADFASGTLAGAAYVLVISGTVNAGASWLCSTPTATIDTDEIQFQQFSIPGQTTAANIGLGTGQLFANKTGNTLNFKTLAAGTHIVLTNNSDNVNLATDATNADTVSTIVSRDALGNFSAGTITASLTGAASLDVLKAGDTMTGNLNMALQSQVRLQDGSGSGNYVGINAPSTVGTSYTLSLPSVSPLAKQVLTAGSVTPTTMQWITDGSTVLPAASKIIYVAKYGNDVTGDGSLSFPFASLAQAIDLANVTASLANPISILINPGVYIENNSAGPLAITAQGVSIDGGSSTAVIIVPSTLSNDLLQTTANTQFGNFTLKSGGVSTASGLVSTAGTVIRSCLITGFNTGLSINGTGSAVVKSCFFMSNNTCISTNNVVVLANDCTISGVNGTGLSFTGAGSISLFCGGLILGCTQGVVVSNNAVLTMDATTFRSNTTGINVTNSGGLLLQSVSFELNGSVGAVANIQLSGAGTEVQISDCIFNSPVLAINNLTALQITDSALCTMSACQISGYQNALIIGNVTDTSSTQLNASGLSITECTNDIIQQGSSTLNFNMGVATTGNISINDSTNVKLAYFDFADNDALQIGSFADQDTQLIEAAIGLDTNPGIDYISSLYNTKALGYFNEATNPVTLFALGSNDIDVTAITTDRTKIAGVRLVSDTGTPVGGTTALRGWDINKNASTAQLSFNYQNSDTVGQVVIPEYTVMQLDGVNNQLQLPNIATQIVLGGDTNLYRAGTDTLETDGNLIIGGLTANRAVATDVNKQLVSSVTTDTELGFVSGVTSSIQTQLNSKLPTGGGTLTGNLQLPAGTTAAPSLSFTGSPMTGLSAVTDNLSLSTAGAERLKISSAGVVSIDGLTPAGVVHNDVSGDLTTSLIVNADVAAGAAIADTKLGTIATVGKVLNSATTATSANTASAIVSRDTSGNFSAGTITAALVGNVTGAASLNVLKAGDIMTGSLTLPAGSTTAPSLQFTGSTGTGLSAGTANTLSLSTNSLEAINISPAGVVTIDNLTSTGVVHNSAAGVLTTSLIVNADVDPAAAIVDTKLATIQTAGKVANSATTATSANTASAIVARDASGNFSAGTITATLTGAASLDVLKAGDTMTGSLQLPVGTTAAPGLIFTGSTTTGLSAPTANTLSLSTNGVEAMKISSTGVVSIDNLTSTGVVHNSSSGILTTSLIVNADVDPAAAIVDTKLATIQTAGKVANSATTATSANTANDIVSRDASGNFSAGTITATLTGAASLDVLKAGDTMTGSLQLPAGTTAAPGLVFTGSTTTGLSAPASNTLSLDTGGSERVNIDGSGNVTITGLASAGVVHTNGSGTLSTSQVVNNDIANSTITNAKLATISSTDTAGNIVVRDGSGNFATNMITIDGTTTNPTDVATKAYVDNAISLGLVAKTPALVASTTNVAITGLQTIDGVTLVANNRVLLVGQTNAVQNGLWLAQSGAWTRPADFANGTLAGEAYVLVTSGTVNAGASWLCSTPTAIIGTDPIEFQQFSLPGQTTAANIGPGAGQLFANKTGNTLNFKTLAAGTHIVLTNNSDNVNLATDATDADTVSTIVSRDASGNFSAGTITAALVGAASLDVLKAGDTMTGSLQLPAGTTAAPGLIFTGSTTTGLSASAGSLSLNTSGVGRLGISSAGVVSVSGLTPAGVMHNDVSGNVTTSLIVNADVSATAAIVDTKLGTIQTTGKVLNSATTATNTNTANAIVSRDASGNFSASTITATLTGAASLDVLKAGDTMTGSLQLPAGTTAAPGLIFTGSTTTGLSAPTANTLSLSTNGVEAMKVSAAGVVSIDNLTATGIVHNSSAGALTTSLIVNADVDPAAAIVDTKLGTIQTAGKVANSATTATSANTASAIVARDASSNFSAGTITAALVGNVTGAASLNVLKAGDTMTGNLTLPAGIPAAPSLQFTGSTNTGLSAASNTLTLSTASSPAVTISPTGAIAFNAMTPAGIVHNDVSGNLTTSLIVNADVAAAAGIVDTKLGTIQTAGKVSNSATTATSANTPSAIVARDASGNFSAGTITATLTGASSLNVLKAGDTMTGSLQLPAGTTAAPGLIFTGSTTTGLSAPTANTLSLSTNGVEAMKVSAAGVVSIDNLTSTGIVHNSSAGALTTSLIIDADVSATAGIVDTKLGTIQTAGKVLNSATTATNANTASAIVARDGSGNFAAGTITAALTGAASLNVLKAGDTMTGSLQLPAGTAVAPGLIFTGSTTTGLSASAGSLSLSASGAQAVGISSAGVVSINGLAGAAGVVHNDVSGNLSSSLIVNADISATAAITDSKLATISTAGKVANSATTATNANTASTIVARDASGNFSAGTITAALTGAASLNVLKAGDTMTGALQLPAGTAAAPALVFTGSTTTGLSAATASTLSFDTAGVERANLSATAMNVLVKLVSTNLICNQATQTASPATGNTVTVNATTSVLILTPAGTLAALTIAFPTTAGLTNGQLLTITCSQTVTTLTLTPASGSTIVNGPTTFAAGARWATFIYLSSATTWYRIA